jgi:hypothetical protein
MISMTYDRRAKSLVSFGERFLSLSLFFAPVEAQNATAQSPSCILVLGRLGSRACSARAVVPPGAERSSQLRESRGDARRRRLGSCGRRKLRKGGIKPMKSLARVNVCALPPVAPPVASPITLAVSVMRAVSPFSPRAAGAPWPQPRPEAPSRHRRCSRFRP